MITHLNLPKILKNALKNGGEFAEIYEDRVEGLQIISESKRLEKINPTLDSGVGIRVLWLDRGSALGGLQKTAYGFTNDVSEKSLLALAAAVAEAVRDGQDGRVLDLASKQTEGSFSVQKRPDQFDLKTKIDFITRAEAVAWKTDPRIKQVKILYSDIRKEMQIANSLGEFVAEERFYTLFFTQAVAEENGLLQTGYYPVGGVIGLELLDQNPPEEVAKIAVRQSLQMLRARPVPAGTGPVVISSEAGGTMVHEAIGHGLEADLAGLGLSVYHDKIGQKIGADHIHIVDDATVPNKRGSFVFDDEGTPAERTVLVEKGILKNYLYDRRMALKDGAVSTGNGRRESYRYRPICRMTNTMILPGADDPASIISTTDTGLFVRKMGGGQVNTVNGDFVFEVSEGYLIQKGKIGDPVRGAILMGNGPKVLLTIDKIGNDHGFGLGTCGKDGQGVPVADAQPTLRIPELVVGGSA